MLLELENVCKDFGAGPVLDQVSFTVERGQSVAVIAPSGAGKSTLLSIVGLLMAPTAGTVKFDGVDVALLSDDEKSVLRAERIGFLFQHTQLIGSLRAVENVALPADFAESAGKKMSDAEVSQRAVEALSALGLEERLYHYPSQMSVGQKRRVATARALFMEPDLIIADEPTNDLDAENAEKVVEALMRRVKTGEAALLYATHDARMAALADCTVRIGESRWRGPLR